MVYVSRPKNLSDAQLLIRSTAPAASAVKYETQHFDLPAVAQGPFIGKGDDVDARWDAISASMFIITKHATERILICFVSWRHDDFP